MEVKTMAEYAAAGETPEVLFWIGCAGSFDQKAQNVTRTFVKILNHLNIKFAVLGTEESCTGDPAKRAGNEFVYQMLALQNIEVMNGYGVKTIVTTCPHCFNIIKNEYPSLGGNYEVIHHSTFLQNLINEGKFKLSDSTQFKGKKITYHDSCYLGRANNIYEAPRAVLETLDADLVEMNSCRSKGLCCGAGGAQVFKEEEHGSKRINVKRTEEALETKADYIATACPYCNIMMSDGVKANDKQDDVKVIDIVELFASGHGLA
ncbi:MAG: (Fe-S)-binding protein [Chitinophagales bacterium]|nr:(Fe-S)-binding protein [Chitinophagales bacterium]MCO5280109.1 (Fe-S)-binding protein [Chitinophagales bacterium]HRN94086.1 (Fe-S)-binding protein [Chitinophagales bacterium]HRP39752.1 (Fe-S)-binding protein [Chitinophagales bacterium]